jgi:hypothetical protein
MGSTSTRGAMAGTGFGGRCEEVEMVGRGFVDSVGVEMLCKTDSARLMVAMAGRGERGRLGGEGYVRRCARALRRDRGNNAGREDLTASGGC